MEIEIVFLAQHILGFNQLNQRSIQVAYSYLFLSFRLGTSKLRNKDNNSTAQLEFQTYTVKNTLFPSSTVVVATE